ncbi:uncharacterized protein [Littorina saxatilis]|uniref:uncharacterized protein n=1 Tax=Littorina saxatilis TaxID=31220 RepID=UPI0038B5E0BC
MQCKKENVYLCLSSSLCIILSMQCKKENQTCGFIHFEFCSQIRAQLGLKPLPMSKVTTNKSVTTGATKARNANVLQSVLLLIRELDKDSLEVVHNSVQRSSSTDCSLATWCHTTTDGWLTAVSHSLTAAVRRGIYRAVT